MRLVQLDPRDRQALLEKSVLLAPQVLPERQEKSDRRDLRDQPALLGKKVRSVLPVRRARREPPGISARQDRLARRERRVK